MFPSFPSPTLSFLFWLSPQFRAGKIPFRFHSLLSNPTETLAMLAINHVIIWLAPRAGKMNQIVRCDWTTRCIPQAKFPLKPYDKTLTDQVCSVKMAGYRLRSFFASLWTSTGFVSVHKHAKKEVGQYPAILTSHLVNNPYVIHQPWKYYIWEKFPLCLH